MIATLVSAPEEHRFRLSLVPWEAYVAFCDCLGERHIRVTYDHGEMEVMTVSSRHERKKTRLRRLVEAITEELEIDIVSGGSMTCRNKEMLRALEPDECYWIENEPSVRDLDDIDLDEDPPPDLACEIEVSRSALDRMAIYAALKVPEVWRWDGETLSVHILAASGFYRAAKKSKAFPFLPIEEFVSYLTRTDLRGNAFIRAFRAWVSTNRPHWKK